LSMVQNSLLLVDLLSNLVRLMVQYIILRQMQLLSLIRQYLMLLSMELTHTI